MLVPGIEITEIPVTDHMTWAFATFRDDQGVTATVELGRSRTDAGYYSTLADIVKSLSGVEIPDDAAEKIATVKDAITFIDANAS